MGVRTKKRYQNGLYSFLRRMSFAIFFAVCFSSAAAWAQLGGYITAQDVYENPDDHDLSLEYAKQQIKRGEMLDAGAALERMLYAQPNWHSARLLYSAVLYRLDDQKAALRELTLLDGKELNANQTATLARYKRTFQIPPKPSLIAQSAAPSVGPQKFLSYASDPTDVIKGSLTIAARADNNAGNALTDESFGFDNQGDVSTVLDTQIRFRQPISGNEDVTLHGDARALIRRHETFSRADYGVYDLGFGISKKVNDNRMGVDIDMRRVNVGKEKYLVQAGPRVSVTSRVSEKTRVTASLSAYAQNYDRLSFATLEDERDGVKTSLQLGVLKKIKDSQRLNFVVGYDTKSAEIGAFAYDGPIVGISFEERLPRETVFKANVRLRQLNFNNSLDPSVDNRSDTRLAARASLGLPIANILPSASTTDAVVEFGVNYNNRESNIQTNDFENLGADIRITFGF